MICPQAARRPQCAVKWDQNLKPKLAIMRQCTSVTDRRTDGLASWREMYILHLAQKAVETIQSWVASRLGSDTLTANILQFVAYYYVFCYELMMQNINSVINAIVHSRLRPGAAFWWTQPNTTHWRPTTAATWWTSSKYNFRLDSGPLATCCENVMLFTKPEVLNISQRHQRRTEQFNVHNTQ